MQKPGDFMNGKLIVVGANQGALAFAYMAAKRGFDVTVYEKKRRADVSYVWTDDFSCTAFSDAGLPQPPEKLLKRTRNLCFIAPNKALFPVGQPEETLDFCVERRPLNAWLEEKAVGAGAKIRYETKVCSALVKDNRVCGVVFENGSEEECDLVVDCGGVDSALRASLPPLFGIQAAVKESDCFSVRRTLFDRAKDSPFPKNPKKIYLKHLGEPGISWCVLTQDEKHADVLIGRVGELSSESEKAALSDLKNENPIIGDGFLPGSGGLYKIPVRPALSKIFAPGYVLLGDSACMTIPMIGSGIAAGFKSAKILAETIAFASEDPFSDENLYRFQLRFMKEIGTFHAVIGIVKNVLLKTETEKINKIIDSGIMSAIVLASEGEKGGVLKAIVSLAKSEPKIFAGILMLVASCVKTAAVCAAMPKKYGEKSFEKWQAAYEKAISG